MMVAARWFVQCVQIDFRFFFLKKIIFGPQLVKPSFFGFVTFDSFFRFCSWFLCANKYAERIYIFNGLQIEIVTSSDIIWNGELICMMSAVLLKMLKLMLCMCALTRTRIFIELTNEHLFCSAQEILKRKPYIQYTPRFYFSNALQNKKKKKKKNKKNCFFLVGRIASLFFTKHICCFFMCRSAFFDSSIFLWLFRGYC